MAAPLSMAIPEVTVVVDPDLNVFSPAKPILEDTPLNIDPLSFEPAPPEQPVLSIPQVQESVSISPLA